MSKNSKNNSKPYRREDSTDKPNLKPSNSLSNLKKGQRVKATLSTKSWSPSTKAKIPNNEEHLEDLQKLNVGNEPEEFGPSNLLRARDSLENLLKSERTFFGNVDVAKAPSCSASSTPETISPRSLPILNETMIVSSMTKALVSESYNKVGKNRGKKEKKKKGSKGLESAIPRDHDPKRDFKSGDDRNTKESHSSNQEYFNFQPKSSKSVVFTNEVMVVYFNGERVISEAKEPLKKELEQQVRNKEMRKGHLLIN